MHYLISVIDDTAGLAPDEIAAPAMSCGCSTGGRLAAPVRTNADRGTGSGAGYGEQKGLRPSLRWAPRSTSTASRNRRWLMPNRH